MDTYMDASKRERLEKAGYRVSTVAEFLGLSAEESELIEIKLALTHALRKQRATSGLSQTEVAERIGSRQSRVAKMEAGDPNVSLDLLIRALLATGVRRDGLAETIAGQAIFPLPPSQVSPTNGSHAEPPKNGGGQEDTKTVRMTAKQEMQEPQSA